MDFSSWLEDLTIDPVSSIASKSGVPLRTLQHQVNANRPSFENLVRISAAYGRHPLHTLVEWGLLDSAWETVPNIEAALKLSTDAQLTNEVLRRLKGGSTYYDRPISDY